MSESTKYIWVVRPVDDSHPPAPFLVWSAEDGRVYAELDGGRYELVRPTAPPPSPTEGIPDAELHAKLRHPDYEYETTDGPRKAFDEHSPDEDDPMWERNVHVGRNGWDRFAYHEEAYWMRRKTPNA